jgi:hypothetical protein
MIKVTITEDGQFVDEIQFDAANVVAYEGALTVIHRDVMQERAGAGLWHLVAHAAGIVAERGNLLDALAAEELQRPDIDTALSILEKAPDVPPEPGDEIRQETDAGKAAIDDDLYHLQRDPSETDEDYRERADARM